MKATAPSEAIMTDLSELINTARAGFTSEARVRWYPKLPKIVTGNTFRQVH